MPRHDMNIILNAKSNPSMLFYFLFSIRYKKFSEAKALKGKSEVDMRAVLGLGKWSSDNTDSHSDSETKKRDSDSETKKKDSKRKRDNAKECANTEDESRPDTKKKK